MSTVRLPQQGERPGGLTIAIAGNPNCGKSALFNALTGIRQKTGNWPGVTVERKEGRSRIDGRDVTVGDLPGIYSFDAASLDEQVTRDYLLSRDADLVIHSSAIRVGNEAFDEARARRRPRPLLALTLGR